jgi:hypothetical protein
MSNVNVDWPIYRYRPENARRRPSSPPCESLAVQRTPRSHVGFHHLQDNRSHWARRTATAWRFEVVTGTSRLWNLFTVAGRPRYTCQKLTN